MAGPCDVALGSAEGVCEGVVAGGSDEVEVGPTDVVVEPGEVEEHPLTTAAAARKAKAIGAEDNFKRSSSARMQVARAATGL